MIQSNRTYVSQYFKTAHSKFRSESFSYPKHFYILNAANNQAIASRLCKL